MTATLIEATPALSELIERAAGGEEIVITRDGKPAARLSAIVEPTRKGFTPEFIEWLETHRVGDPSKPVDGVAALTHIRDNDWR